MTSSDRAHRLPSAAPRALQAVILVVALGSVACGGADKKSSPEAAPVAPPAASVTVTVTVAPVQPDGRRDASVTVESTAALTDVQLDFEVPEACQRIAGAATRKIPAVPAGQPLSQGIGMQCPAGATGVVRVKLAATDAAARPVEASGEGAL